MELVIIGGKEAEDKLRDNFTRVLCEIVIDMHKDGTWEEFVKKVENSKSEKD